ncbi:UDP-N-acetylhexosamine pyrophosphorylase [Bacillus rossius redtenbacheri]|uniref:UDP-N-acetylhexosamine pyrophosphorylase n=1 Tax=Bacillus rossius redtenbacheri TaxID=93214 RepID=UPI002FDDA32E
MLDAELLKKELAPHGQEHLVRFWGELSEAEREQLCADVRAVDVAEVVEYFRRTQETSRTDQQKLDDRMKPIPPHIHGSAVRSGPREIAAYEAEGLLQVSRGKVGVLLMAGGQGTRLGVTYPKGMYDVGLPSHKTLYQLQAERILRLEELAYSRTGRRGSVAWYIMTSEATMEPTLRFFEQHAYFGLDRRNVVVFEQGLLPCFTFDGKIILDGKNRLSKAPDGNGGLYRALREEKVLDDMERRGIEYLHAHAVDNILVKVADPVFIGYCIKKGADCGAKVVEKTNPTEAVGVVCEVDGRFQVVEYSEITPMTAERCNNDGRLTFSAGSICNHFFTRQFLRHVADRHERKLRLHVAKKKIPYVDASGHRVVPDKPNGIKMEKFVFDVFPFSERFVTWEVDRTEEFSPVKNADSTGKDCPATARNDLFALHRRYLELAGGMVTETEEDFVCEISPLVSYAGENLEGSVADAKLRSPIVIWAEGEVPASNGTVNGTAGYINEIHAYA